MVWADWPEWWEQLLRTREWQQPERRKAWIQWLNWGRGDHGSRQGMKRKYSNEYVNKKIKARTWQWDWRRNWWNENLPRHYLSQRYKKKWSHQTKEATMNDRWNDARHVWRTRGQRRHIPLQVRVQEVQGDVALEKDIEDEDTGNEVLIEQLNRLGERSQRGEPSLEGWVLWTARYEDEFQLHADVPIQGKEGRYHRSAEGWKYYSCFEESRETGSTGKRNIYHFKGAAETIRVREFKKSDAGAVGTRAVIGYLCQENIDKLQWGDKEHQVWRTSQTASQGDERADVRELMHASDEEGAGSYSDSDPDKELFAYVDMVAEVNTQ